MTPLEALRLVVGALVLFVLPGLAWALATKPALRRDPPGLAFWSVAGSLALLVLYGTALGFAGAFRASLLVAYALVLAAAGAAVAARRWNVDEAEPDPGEDGRARVERLRRLKVEATMLRKEGRAAEARAKFEEARDEEGRMTREMYGR